MVDCNQDSPDASRGAAGADKVGNMDQEDFFKKDSPDASRGASGADKVGDMDQEDLRNKVDEDRRIDDLGSTVCWGRIANSLLSVARSKKSYVTICWHRIANSLLSVARSQKRIAMDNSLRKLNHDRADADSLAVRTCLECNQAVNGWGCEDTACDECSRGPLCGQCAYSHRWHQHNGFACHGRCTCKSEWKMRGWFCPHAPQHWHQDACHGQPAVV